MSKLSKLLVVRFSSIGDIVLTSPVVRILKQNQFEVHFLTKKKYAPLLANNPNIDKLYCFNKTINEAKSEIVNENYDFIIDLHNNIRSQSLRLLNVPIKRYSKSNFKKFIYMNFNLNFLNDEHVVDRYVKTISFLNLKNDNKGLDFFLNPNDKVEFDINQNFASWCIGASKKEKKLSKRQILKIIASLNLPVVLLGGEDEKEMGDAIVAESQETKIYNYCGNITVNQSAYLIKYSQFLLTNDTGLMHIGAAFNKKIISFWGCTKPDLGFAPYVDSSQSLIFTSSFSKRQCSKHGSSCRYTKNGCVKTIDTDKAIKKIVRFTS